jgi:hypothetical protein
MKITVKTLVGDEVTWQDECEVAEGAVVNVRIGHIVERLREENLKMREFIETCSRKGGGMVSGNRLAIAANTLLGRGAVIDYEPTPTQSSQP